MASPVLFLCACLLLLAAGHRAADSYPAHRAGEEGARTRPLVARRGLVARKPVASSGSPPVKGAVDPKDAATLLRVAARWRKQAQGKSSLTKDVFHLLATWNVTRPCLVWYGVTCHSATHRVTAIKLPKLTRGQSDVFVISGPYPEELGSLLELRSIILARNPLSGPFPKQWARLGKLSHLDLSETSLSYDVIPVPEALCNLTSLTYLNLAGIGVTVPKAFLRLSRLAYLNLGYQGGFGGDTTRGDSIEIIGRLTGLKFLFLPYCGLYGSDTMGLSRLRSLEQLDLSYNPLASLSSGDTLPSFLSGFTQLLDLKLNSLKDTKFDSLTMPSWLGSLKRLISLSLCCNDMTGSIDGLGELKALVNPDMKFNQLTGSIPQWLGELTSLQTLSLSYNQLSGSLSASLLEPWAHRLSAEVQTGVSLPGKLDVSWNFLSGPCYSSSVASLKCPSSNKTCQRILAQDVSGLAGNCLQGCNRGPLGRPPIQRGSHEDVNGFDLGCSTFCGADGPNGPCNGHGVCSSSTFLSLGGWSPECACSKGFVELPSNPGTCVQAAKRIR